MKFLKTKILDIKKIEDLIILKIPFNGEEVFPGQFFMIGSKKANVLLNRPFSVSDYYDNVLTFRIKIIGKFTEFLTTLTTSDELRIVGPCGNGFKDEDLKDYKKIILIGGGIGIAPLIYFNRFFKKKREVDFIFGIPSKKYLYFLNDTKISNLKIYTEDGSLGEKGFPTDYINSLEEKNTMIIACGPIEMYKAMLGKKINIKVLMEQNMACGFGACLGCVVKTKIGFRRVCTEGPIFDLGDIEWK